jgi:hypothetical protein
MFSNIPNELFRTDTKIQYPPFKKGYYMEEYFLNYVSTNNIPKDKEGRLYIPALWTNFQTAEWFPKEFDKMQFSLDDWIREHPNEKGYFVVVQHDDGPMLKVPKNTKIYGACSGNIPLPLIYEDIEYKLENIDHKTYKDKDILCSFVGSITHGVRKSIIDMYEKNNKFKFSYNKNWTNNVQIEQQKIFIENTVNSKFALAPRGYGKSSFRFFEIFKLGTIPIYVWDDKNWLPYIEKIDYDAFCISIHISEINILEEIMLSINEKKYNKMLLEYEKIKHMFQMEYMCEYICGKTNILNKTNTNPEDNLKVLNTIFTKQAENLNVLNKIITKSKSNVLLVTIAIGERYLQQYNNIFRKNHEMYAKKNDYDFKVITDYLDKSMTHVDAITFNKTLVCSQEWSNEYEYIVLIDADILINMMSPAIHSSINFENKIGIVNEYSQPTMEVRLQIQRMMGWEPDAKGYYKLAQLDIDTKMVFNTGVMVLQPRIHKEFLENIYKKYVKKSINHYRRYHYEQSCIGYELQKNNNYKILDNKWNTIWPLYKIVGSQLELIFIQNNFIHFTGHVDIEEGIKIEEKVNR